MMLWSKCEALIKVKMKRSITCQKGDGLENRELSVIGKYNS